MMMRFVLGVALAVCGVVQGGETVPYVSGQVEFAPTSNNGNHPFYWNLGGGQGLLVAGGDYLDVQQAERLYLLIPEGFDQVNE